MRGQERFQKRLRGGRFFVFQSVDVDRGKRGRVLGKITKGDNFRKGGKKGSIIRVLGSSVIAYGSWEVEFLGVGFSGVGGVGFLEVGTNGVNGGIGPDGLTRLAAYPAWP